MKRVVVVTTILLWVRHVHLLRPEIPLYAPRTGSRPIYSHDKEPVAW